MHGQGPRTNQGQTWTEWADAFAERLATWATDASSRRTLPSVVREN